MSPKLAQLVEADKTNGLPAETVDPDTLKAFRRPNVPCQEESLHRVLATGIYKTQDCRFYHVHGKYILWIMQLLTYDEDTFTTDYC